MMGDTLREILGLALPIIQAPMAGVQDSELAIAVCNAGALGSLPAAMLDPDTLASELDTIGQATQGPYNVNFFCHQPPQYNAERDADWQRDLAPFYRQWNIAEGGDAATSGRAPFSEASLEVLEIYTPPVVSFHFGLPAEALLLRVKAWGAKVICSATTVAEAQWLERRGVDVIIAQGLEAGGHRGLFLTSKLSQQLGTFALLPQICAAVSVPVVAAGGIASAQGVSAAMALGAAGVQVGTTYLLCPEANTSPLHRAALRSERAQHTAVSNRFTGRPARAIVNRMMQDLGPVGNSMPDFPLAAHRLAPLRAAAEAQGKDDFTSLWCGQNASGCAEIPAAELTRRLAAGL